MIKLKKSYLISTAVTLMCAAVIAVFYLNDMSVVFGDSNSIDDALLKNLGEDEFYSVYDYKYIDLNVIQLVSKERDVSFYLPEFDGNDKDRLYKIVDHLEQYTYTQGQSNPNKVEDLGGNCQALSIMFRDICKHNGVNCTIIGTNTHALNLVSIGEEEYKVDITNRTLERR